MGQPAKIATPYWRLSSFYFFYFAFLGVWVPYWNLYLEDLGLTAQAIGIISAIVMATKIIAPSLWGWMADRSGSRASIIRLGAFLAFISFLLVFVTPPLSVSLYLWLSFIVFLYSFFWNAILAQYEVITLSHLSGRYERYSRIRLWGSIGFIVAVALGGYFFDYFPISLVAPILALLLGLIWFSSHLVTEKPQAESAHESTEGLWNIIANPAVMAFLIACFLLQVAHGPYYTFYSIYLESFGYSRGTIGLLWSLGVVAEVVLFIFIHRLFDRYSMRTILLITLLLSAIRWLMIAFGESSLPTLLLAQLFHAASFGAFHAVAIELMRRFFTGGHQGQGQAVYSGISFGAGGAVGALISGYMWHYSPKMTFLMAAIACIIALVICYIWVRGQHLEQPNIAINNTG